MKKIFNRNSLFYQALKCWHGICIKDKSLIIIMIVLLLQSLHNLFAGEPTTPTGISIDVIIRTTMAGIFGYFLSENFLKGDTPSNDSNKPSNTSVSSQSSIKSCSIDEESIRLQDNFSKNDDSHYFKHYICNKTFQVMIALLFSLIALITLIIGQDFGLFASTPNPTVIQFRDLISSCVGFLLGHSSSKR